MHRGSSEMTTRARDRSAAFKSDVAKRVTAGRHEAIGAPIRIDFVNTFTI